MMSPFRLSYLLMVVCLLLGYTPTLAQTFQAPGDGVYTCFSSQESPLDSNAQQIGTLEIKSSNYTFTVGSNSESGTVVAQEEDLSEAVPFATAGSAVTLTSSNNSVIIGFFAVDASGGSYILTNNAQGIWIRCDSPGADMQAAVDGLQNSSSETSTPEIPTARTLDTSSMTASLTPLSKVVPGTYQCFIQNDFAGDSEYDDKEPVEAEASFQLFDTGEFINTNPDVYSFEKTGTYLFDQGTLQLPETESFYSEKIFDYGELDGTPVFTWYQTEDSEYYDEASGQFIDGVDKKMVACMRSSDVTEAPPSVAETEEYNLQPEAVKAPAPPAGAGGLSGLFVFTDFEYQTDTYTDANGFPLSRQMLTQIDTGLFFFPEGYVLEGDYDWGYSELDCTRVYKDGSNICSTYTISGETLSILSPDGKEEKHYTFEKAATGLSLDGNFYTYREPVAQDFVLDGVYNRDYVNGNNSGNVTITFYPDRSFVDDSGSFYFAGSANGGGTALVTDCSGTVGGTTTVTQNTADPNDTTTVTTSSEDTQECNNIGSYKIQGYDLMMNFADGRQSKWFLSLERDEQGEVKTIYINQEIFWEKGE
jgi:hypothetical protein